MIHAAYMHIIRSCPLLDLNWFAQVVLLCRVAVAVAGGPIALWVSVDVIDR